MLDGIFHPSQKRPEGGVITDDEEDVLDSETRNEEDVPDLQTNTNTDDEHSQNEASNENTIVHNNGNDVSPSISNITTTFGSANRTTHNLLRKKSCASRNNSLDSTNTIIFDNESRRSKIRIEARIDSDRRSIEPMENPETTGSGVRRSLRYANEEDNTVRPREPEIIEMILISPSKTQHTASVSKNGTQMSSNLVTPSITKNGMSFSPRNLEDVSKELATQIAPKETITPRNAKRSSVRVSATDPRSVTSNTRSARKRYINEQKSVSTVSGVSAEEVLV